MYFLQKRNLPRSLSMRAHPQARNADRAERALRRRSPLHNPVNAAQSGQDLALTGTAQTLDLERTKRIVYFFKASASAYGSSSHCSQAPCHAESYPLFRERTETNIQTPSKWEQLSGMNKRAGLPEMLALNEFSLYSLPLLAVGTALLLAALHAYK